MDWKHALMLNASAEVISNTKVTEEIVKTLELKQELPEIRLADKLLSITTERCCENDVPSSESTIFDFFRILYIAGIPFSAFTFEVMFWTFLIKNHGIFKACPDKEMHSVRRKAFIPESVRDSAVEISRLFWKVTRPIDREHRRLNRCYIGHLCRDGLLTKISLDLFNRPWTVQFNDPDLKILEITSKKTCGFEYKTFYWFPVDPTVQNLSNWRDL